MAAKALPSPDYLRKRLRYDPETGHLFWLPYEGARPCVAARCFGKRAFTTPLKNGYLMGRLDGQPLYAHRVIMAIVNGEWPLHDVDHINRDRSDNRLCNLRVATRQQNLRNTCASNASGVVGVTWSKRYRKWVAQITVGYENIYLGRHERLEDAIAARRAAEEAHGWHQSTPRAVSHPGVCA